MRESRIKSGSYLFSRPRYESWRESWEKSVTIGNWCRRKLHRWVWRTHQNLPFHGCQSFIQDFSTGGGPASVPLCSHPRYARFGGGGNYVSTDLIGPVGSGGLHIMHCAPNTLLKIVGNHRLCGLLQGRIQDFPLKVRSRHAALSENFGV